MSSEKSDTSGSMYQTLIIGWVFLKLYSSKQEAVSFIWSTYKKNETDGFNKKKKDER